MTTPAAKTRDARSSGIPAAIGPSGRLSHSSVDDTAAGPTEPYDVEVHATVLEMCADQGLSPRPPEWH